MIRVRRCYAVLTEESAEVGEYAEQWADDPVAYTFRELVDALRHSTVSCWPSTGSVYEWCTVSQDKDYITGDETTETLHYDSDQSPHNARYWRLAFRAAGLCK